MEKAFDHAFGSHNNHLEMTKLIMSGNYGLMHFYEMIVIPTLDTASYNDPNHDRLLSTLKICCEALTRKLRNIGKVSKHYVSLLQSHLIAFRQERSLSRSSRSQPSQRYSICS